ncbi:hypothetical protein DAEQUDRAFT_257008 [Daedalea quercina L-15889]|uniref:Fe2OG dioxygenase domain-containing protein n=1 Tax=Daedalea quercina L-15889 TaxID=1314783 RepID=A0A165QJC0_9APHY|nr:hypothetical protein DAEQUDRAFT_257008 [Daedalea quercina L-15889]
MQFDAVQAGLLDVVSTKLFEGKGKALPIHAELYKLNVYDKGSFFKPHMDTLREETMFGSLVITFPTKHEGGLLTFRREGKEWSVDSGKLISEQDELSVVYAAFYSDVEHEVLPVQRGYRVTATYNLYFVPQRPQFSKSVGNPIPAHRSTLEAAFTALLANPTFLLEGGCLGFGLRHRYPLNQSAREGSIKRTVLSDDEEDMYEDEEGGSDDEDMSTSEDSEGGSNDKAKETRRKPPLPFVPGLQLRALEQYLKGGDAMLKQVCEELKLKSVLGIVYRARESMWDNVTNDVLCARVVNLENPDRMTLGPDGDPIPESLVDYLRRWYGGRTLTNNGWRKRRDLEVEWVTDSPEVNLVKQEYIAYGNQAETMHAYFRVCLFVTVGAPSARETASESVV